MENFIKEHANDVLEGDEEGDEEDDYGQCDHGYLTSYFNKESNNLRGTVTKNINSVSFEKIHITVA